MSELFEALHMKSADTEIPFQYADACALSDTRIFKAQKHVLYVQVVKRNKSTLVEMDEKS